MSDAIDWTRTRPVNPPWPGWPQTPPPYYPAPPANGWPWYWSDHPWTTEGGTVTADPPAVPTRSPLSPADFARPDDTAPERPAAQFAAPAAGRPVEAIAHDSRRALKEIRALLQDESTAATGRARIRLLCAYLCGYVDGAAVTNTAGLGGFGTLFVDRAPASEDDVMDALAESLNELAQLDTRGTTSGKDTAKKVAAVTGLVSAIAKVYEAYADE